jgi:Ras-related protein Rab-7A
MALHSDKMVKILLIGNSGVGKSSILLQYSDKKFAHSYYNTIGVDYVTPYSLRESNISTSEARTSNYKL